MTNAINNAANICREVFQNTERFPASVSYLISSYIPEETAQLLPFFDTTQPFRFFTNLTDQNCLRVYLGTENERALSKAAEIAARIYETRGPISQIKYGKRFPMDCEVLALAMQFAKEAKVALEMGGADGENAILLAFTSILLVYMNEICPEEMENFHELQASLPDDIKKKLISIMGSCFDLLRSNSELANKVGLILCRNLIHFFNDKS